MSDESQHVDDMEKETRYTIIQMEDDEDNENASSIFADAKIELSRMYAEFRQWIKNNVNAQETTQRLEKLKTDTALLLETTKQKVAAFNQREDVKNGKEKLNEMTGKVTNAFSDGVDELMKKDYVVKTMDTITDTVSAIREDERVKKNVKKLKKGTLKAVEKAFEGLQRVLDTKDEDD